MTTETIRKLLKKSNKWLGFKNCVKYVNIQRFKQIKVFRNDAVLNFFQHNFKIIKMDFLAKRN